MSKDSIKFESKNEITGSKSYFCQIGSLTCYAEVTNIGEHIPITMEYGSLTSYAIGTVKELTVEAIKECLQKNIMMVVNCNILRFFSCESCDNGRLMIQLKMANYTWNGMIFGVTMREVTNCVKKILTSVDMVITEKELPKREYDKDLECRVYTQDWAAYHIEVKE